MSTAEDLEPAGATRFYQRRRRRLHVLRSGRRRADAPPRRLPRARCPGCGAEIGKDQLKWAVVERLIRNRRITSKVREAAIRAIFPEDTPAPPRRTRKKAAG